MILLCDKFLITNLVKTHQICLMVYELAIKFHDVMLAMNPALLHSILNLHSLYMYIRGNTSCMGSMYFNWNISLLIFILTGAMDVYFEAITVNQKVLRC